ncbi:MAG: hypothetical protein NW224_23510 [Leptolyngbyaceae cyanobacterium bins.302]|nr:hypothetical protein [Leptolyngbyaceae cyanobacterium bins.302]
MLDAAQKQNLRWQWVLATTLGWLAAPIVGLLGLLVREPVAMFAVMPFTGFVLVGVAQWFVIRRYIHSARMWAFTGFPAGIGIGAIIASQIWAKLATAEVVVFFVGLAALGGALLGISQWWLLKPHSSKAQRWIVVNPLAWVIGLIPGAGIAFLGMVVVGAGAGLERAIWAIIGGVLTGLVVVAIVVGIITGNTLVWLLNSSHSASNPDELTEL